MSFYRCLNLIAGDMHLITKHIRLILVLILPLVSYTAFGQRTHAKFNRD